VGEVRHVFTRFGGNLGASGCVAYLFEKRGLLLFDADGLDSDALLEAALESGADDAVESDAQMEVLTAPGDFETVKSALEEKGFTPLEAEVTFQPTTTVKLEGSQAETMLRIADALDDLDDVQNVYANFDISDAEMARLAES
jgi:transcriptional/translational regulatory protein YebC/TACO1